MLLVYQNEHYKTQSYANQGIKGFFYMFEVQLRLFNRRKATTNSQTQQ